MQKKSLFALTLLIAWGCNGATPAASESTAPQAAAPAPTVPAKRGPEGNSQPTLPKGTLVLEAAPRPPVTLTVEVASTPRQQQMGLMFRETLGPTEGMIFLFPEMRKNSFWMHNTLLPLDMFFIDADWKVVGVVENAEPLTDTPREVNALSQYVLETKAGFAKEHGISRGTIVRFAPPEGM